MASLSKQILLFLILTLTSFSTFSQTKKAQWLEDDRFGMFIHWGLYSATEGIWKGERLRHPNNYAEWIRYRNRIGEAEYGELAKRFDWDKINPEEWVLLAKKAGMKYIVITSKHHDGVALWDSKVSDYSLPKLSGTNRDVIKEIADACKKHNIKLCFYYSHWIDWQHPYAWNHNQEVTGRVTDAQYNQYWQEKVLPQIRELLTNYGDIAMMWFDMWIPYQQSIIKKEQLDQLANLIHELQPKCLINSRLGFPIENEHVDFETLGDNQFGSAYTDHIWETPGTIAHSWGFNALENEWKSSNQLFQSLINNVSLNGSYTLNIGPRADGSVPYEGVQRLMEMGQWLSKYGQAVYYNNGLPIRFSQHDWGKMTINNKTKELYLHVYNWPLDKILRVTGLQSKPTKIEVLNGNKSQAVKFEQWGPIIHIHVPEEQPDPFVSVLKVTMDQPQFNTEVVAESTFGGFSLYAKNHLSKGLEFKAFDGTKPDHLVLKANQKVQWKVYLPEAGEYSIESSIHNGSGKTTQLSIKDIESTFTVSAAPNGKVTVEPNQNWYVEEFLDVPVGKINITKPIELTLEFSASDPILFNRIWIEKKKK